MSAVSVKNLTFGYEGAYDNVFEDVSFQIDSDWRLGLIGRNGRGKTTFLNLLMGKLDYEGEINYSGLRFEYFPYKPKNTKEIAVECLREVCPQAEDWELLRETSLLGVEAESLYRAFDTLSEGEKTKLMLGALFLGGEKFLLIDEPTNHLDKEGRKKVGEYLSKKKGFILVSHDRELLDRCADHILSINRGSVEVMQGNFSVWYENSRQKENFERNRNEKLKKEIERLGAGAKQAADWAFKVEKSKNNTTSSGSKLDKGYVGHKSAKMMKRAKNAENRMTAAAKEKEGLLKETERSGELKLSPIEYGGESLARAYSLSAFYGDKAVFEDLYFEIKRGERISVSGKNGCGKSTLLKLLVGEKIEYKGVFEIGGGLKISYVSQDTSFLEGGLSEFASESEIDESLFFAILYKMGFDRVQFEKDLRDLSMGQKKKVLLAKSLCEKAHLYVWDEPLNYIDVISRIQLEELLLKYKPTMIFVEHDSAFAGNIATREILL